VPEQATLPYLQAAFGEAAQGRTDRTIARYLNENGQRIGGVNGNKPFSTSSVRGILTNHFYVAQLTDGKGGYIPAKHKLSISRENLPGVQTVCRSLYWSTPKVRLNINEHFIKRYQPYPPKTKIDDQKTE
jgi:Recombinase